MVRHAILVAGLLSSCAAIVSAEQPPAPRFALPVPDDATVSVTRNVRYSPAGADDLRMDVYRPSGQGGARPAMVFFNRAAGPDQRNNPFYDAWARVAAGRGLVAILPDLRGESAAADFDLLTAHLVAEHVALGIDRDALAVYAGSGNVSLALPIVQAPARTAVKAAVMYYGAAEVERYRRDLPVLFVRAGLDRPPVNAAIDALATRAVRQNAPFTLLNHPSGYHAFEIANDDALTRQVMEATIQFVKEATGQAYQAAIREGLLEATAAGQVASGEAAAAAATYARLVARRPDDARLGLAYGEALLANRQFTEACAQFDTLRGKGLGFRDLGLPAARACMQKGDAEAAIAWLRSIPLRFLPPSVADEPLFAPIRDRAEFQAVFRDR
jgi:dienelactone hydrolase